jgi:hypothetical protein
MTLCIAWIRQENENQELVFATDSMLTGSGETWKHGVKLFELPRKDCLLCFAGETEKAYPLILNLISSIKFDQSIMNQHTDIRQVLEYLCNTFTHLINSLDYQLKDSEYNPYTAAKFIFGGWNWKNRMLEFWEIYYGMDEKRYLYNGFDSKNPRAYLMIGDDLTEAEEIFVQELSNNGKRIQGHYDMEPFLVLSKIARDPKFRSIDGALQVAKIYQSGSSEFFGVMWQSVKGKHTFLGRELNPYVKPQIRFIDPDTGVILDHELPKNVLKLKTSDYGNEETFINECYPNGEQKPDLSEKQKEMLLAIFKDNSYKTFLAQITSDVEVLNPVVDGEQV